MEEKIERNKIIYVKKKMGATYRQLSMEYGLSITTLQEIIKRFRIREEIERISETQKEIRKFDEVMDHPVQKVSMKGKRRAL